jgi:predicted phage baseplate assembly protein
MPLADVTPVIDDRRYSDIVEEIKTRIARYTPEWQAVWTDYNDSDPGITLAQLVAWMSDMLLYRMGKVPAANYIKFLELLGIELGAAQPANVAVTFPVKAGTTVAYVDVPKCTQVSAPADDGGPPVIFETQAALRALTAQLLSLQAFDGSTYTDLTAANAAADTGPPTLFQPFGPLPIAGGAFTIGLGFPSGFPNPTVLPPLEFDISVFVADGIGGQTFVSCGTPVTPSYAPARLQWEGWTGSDWVPLDALRDSSLALTRTGVVTLRTPAAGTLGVGYLGSYVNDGTVPALFWIRGRLTLAQYATPPQLQAVRLNTTQTLQAQTVRGEVLGGTDGTRNQSWTLANRPVIPGTVQMQIDEGSGPTLWNVLPDLLASGPESTDLALAPSSGVLTAGDGVHGAVPVANAQNPDANVVALRYSFGGGTRGNVAAQVINALLTAVDGIDTGKVTNLFAAVGGSDEEPLSGAEDRARLQIRSQSRAVTAEDFEGLAKQAGQVARAKALPLFHPQFPTIPVPGVVSVIIVPKATPIAGVPFAPVPSDGLMRTVCAYLNARRLLTSELYVLAPSYQVVVVTTTVVPAADADSATVWRGVEQALATYFDPLAGGDSGQGWGFGDTIRYSKVYQRIFSADGVDSIESLTISLDGQSYPACQDVPINANGLLASGDHQVQVTLSAAEAAA